MFKRFKEYRKKRELAHKILGELLPEKDAEIHKKVGMHYFVTDQNGRTIFQDERMGFGKLERCYVDFRSFKVILKEYTETEITQALQLLISNGDIEIEDKLKPDRIDMVSFALSPKGRIAHDEMVYLSSKFADVHPIVDKFRTGAITALFSLTVGIILWSIANRKQAQADSRQDMRLNNLSDSIANLREYTRDSAKHK